MSQAALRPPLVQKILLSVLSGPDKGVAFELSEGKAVLGRDPGCDISLNDPRISRRHAEIEFGGETVLIRDLGSQHGLKVDGKACRQSMLMPGSRVQIGDTEFQLNLDTRALPQTFDRASTPVSRTDETASMAFSSPSAAKNKKIRFYAIAGTVLALLVWALASENAKSGKKQEIRNDAAIQAEIEAIQKRKELIERDKQFSGAFNEQYKAAQSPYIQCFRDYREGNYGRAIQNCTAALAIYPDHLLAQKYRRISERKQDEVIQYSMFEGRRYMEQNKYDLAQSAYRNILILVNDPSNKTYREAEERLKEIQLLLRGRY